ncbi:acyl-CoA dehydrogenase family protein [Bacillus sp. Marseille-P3661]|uniref:acyl-CoA dehydrogenase family protein n=1 Tax=Bacillus sp. Marseille-P3661 TaxID=1936234 RepID=UPI000C8607A8|nr:acyl-CoA dehydrogenase family protein [Bacillus sp. Marseille-P3661]
MTMSTLTSTDFLKKAVALAKQFSVDAAERDKAGGTAKIQKDAIRESGLLNILIPKKYGGEGQTWSTVLQVVREIAKTDASVAHLYGYHFLQLVTPHLCCSLEQKEFFYRESARGNWFWGNCFNPLDKRLIGKKDGDSIILNGTKTFSTGSQDADRLLLSWVWEADGQEIGAAAIPITRAGVNVHDDWDGIGQRQTDSGTVTFENAIVYPDEILDRTYSDSSVFATLDAVLSQIILANVFVGIAEGALADAKSYTKEKTRAWKASGVSKATADPYILRRYGDFWIQLQAAISLVDKAGNKVDGAWERGHDLTKEERGEVVLHTGSANAFASTVGLEITSGIFEVMGARSAAGEYGFDRYWRNIRTHTLHNPLEYKRKNIGNWYLNDEYPAPGAYS